MASLDRPSESDTERLTDPRGLAYLSALAGMARGQKYVTELADDAGGRLQVTDGPDSRGVVLECRRRADDCDRWWLCWAGGIWLCEADRPADALVQIKGALRRIPSRYGDGAAVLRE